MAFDIKTNSVILHMPRATTVNIHAPVVHVHVEPGGDGGESAEAEAAAKAGLELDITRLENLGK